MLLAVAAISLLAAPIWAQERSPIDPVPFDGGHVPDHLKTIVIGTRFVRAVEAGVSPDRQFKRFRVPVSDFNDTDHCVDSASLEVAEGYFRTLGQMLEKTGYYYEIPQGEIDRLRADCIERHGAPPAALDAKGTTVLAFGRVVSTSDAPALERDLR